MTKVNCGVAACVHNASGACSLPEVQIGGENFIGNMRQAGDGESGFYMRGEWLVRGRCLNINTKRRGLAV